MLNLHNSIPQRQQRFFSAVALVVFFMVVLVVRLFFLQIVNHDVFDNKAENNRTSLILEPPLRGEIFDRHLTTLVTNTINYTLEVYPNIVKDPELTFAKLRKFIAISDADIQAFKRRRKESKFLEPVILRTELSPQEMAIFSANSYLFPGVEINTRYFRQYPFKEVGSHAVGYIGRINQNDLTRLDEENKIDNYRGTNNIGKHGIELQYEDLLHGIAGIKTVEISAGGRVIRELNTVPSKQGYNLQLTIDIKLQQLVENLLGDRRGAAIVLDPSNGELLAFVSKPTFDPNLFVDGIDVENWKRLNESLSRPLFNRALRGTYPPGSTYKPFMALAGLATNTRRAETLIYDPGFWEFGKHRYRSPGGGLGYIDLKKAITYSSNVYFYTLAYEMGVEKIYAFNSQFGFGKKTAVDLLNEASGILPNKSWKFQRFSDPKKQAWLIGETIPLGIGQGYNSFTMLQLANALVLLVNRGSAWQPHLLKSFDDHTGKKYIDFKPQFQQIELNNNDVELVLRAMEQVLIKGSGRRAFAGAPYTAGGKTGTAQVAGIPQGARYNEKLLAEYKKDNSVFIGFAPFDKPKAVVAVVVENAGWGARAAAPIARRIFDYLILNQYNDSFDKGAVAALVVDEANNALEQPLEATVAPTVKKHNLLGQGWFASPAIVAQHNSFRPAVETPMPAASGQNKVLVKPRVTASTLANGDIVPTAKPPVAPATDIEDTDDFQFIPAN